MKSRFSIVGIKACHTSHHTSQKFSRQRCGGQGQSWCKGKHLGVVMAAQRLHLPQTALDGLAFSRFLLGILVRVESGHLGGIISYGKGAIQEHKASLVAPEDVVDEDQAYQSSCKVTDICDCSLRSSGRVEIMTVWDAVLVLNNVHLRSSSSRLFRPFGRDRHGGGQMRGLYTYVLDVMHSLGRH